MNRKHQKRVKKPTPKDTNLDSFKQESNCDVIFVKKDAVQFDFSGPRFVKKTSVGVAVVAKNPVTPKKKTNCTKMIAKLAQKLVTVHVNVQRKRELPKKAPEKNFRCPACLTWFTRRDSLERHLNCSCFVAPKKVYACEEKGCNATYKRLDDLNRHLNQHSEYPVLHKCPYCRRLFYDRNTLWRHDRLKHQPGKK